MSVTEPQSTNDTSYWNEHWNRYSAATRMNPGQHYRRKVILKMLGVSAQKKGATILDIGCGAGDLLETIAVHCPKAEIGGIDRSDWGLDFTKRNLPDAILRKVDLESNEFDPSGLKNWASHVVCSEVLEHIEHPVSVLKKMSKFLKPGGALVITVPGGPQSAFDKSIGHFRHYTPAKLRNDLTEAGYQVELVSGSGFPVFNLYRLIILMRGDKLTQDIVGQPRRLARLVMAVFRVIINCSLYMSPWGWQVIAIAHKGDE